MSTTRWCFAPSSAPQLGAPLLPTSCRCTGRPVKRHRLYSPPSCTRILDERRRRRRVPRRRSKSGPSSDSRHRLVRAEAQGIVAAREAVRSPRPSRRTARCSSTAPSSEPRARAPRANRSPSLLETARPVGQPPTTGWDPGVVIASHDATIADGGRGPGSCRGTAGSFARWFGDASAAGVHGR